MMTIQAYILKVVKFVNELDDDCDGFIDDADESV